MTRVLPMINAEFLKLRKRRGLFWLTLFLTSGSVIVMNLIVTLYHLSNPAKYGPAGGLNGLAHADTMFAVTAGLAAVLIGATAGAQDLSTGVFRSLVATGQSRIKLALVRIPGGLLLLLPMLALGFGLETAASFVLAGGQPTPDAGTVAMEFGWLVTVGVLDFVVALGLAALVQSRGTAIGILVAWQLAGSRLIESISAFGNWRALASSVAADRLLPGATDVIKVNRIDSITVSVTAAVAVIVAWIAIATVLGVWRTTTQDA